MALSEEQIAFYKENGYLAVEGLVPRERVQAMRDRFDWLCENWESDEAKRVGVGQEADQGGVAIEKSAATVRKFGGLVNHEPVFREHALSAELTEAVADLIGTPLSLYGDQALLKPPKYGSEKPPHQDNAYFQVDPADGLITAWCALDDATPENGCMQYIPGSQKLGLVDHESIENTPHLVPKEMSKDAAVAVPVKAGGVIFHHPLSLHLSAANKSDKWRRAMICHYVRSDATMPKVKDPSGLLQVLE